MAKTTGRKCVFNNRLLNILDHLMSSTVVKAYRKKERSIIFFVAIINQLTDISINHTSLIVNGALFAYTLWETIHFKSAVSINIVFTNSFT